MVNKKRSGSQYNTDPTSLAAIALLTDKVWSDYCFCIQLAKGFIGYNKERDLVAVFTWSDQRYKTRGPDLESRSPVEREQL